MMSGFGWAKHPMLNRMHEVKEEKPITILYGSRSWIDKSSWDLMKNARASSYVNVQVLRKIVRKNITETKKLIRNWNSKRWYLEPATTYSQINLMFSINLWTMHAISVIICRKVLNRNKHQVSSSQPKPTRRKEYYNYFVPICSVRNRRSRRFHFGEKRYWTEQISGTCNKSDDWHSGARSTHQMNQEVY